MNRGGREPAKDRLISPRYQVDSTPDSRVRRTASRAFLFRAFLFLIGRAFPRLFRCLQRFFKIFPNFYLTPPNFHCRIPLSFVDDKKTLGRRIVTPP